MSTYTTTYGREINVEPVSVLLLQRLTRAIQQEFEDAGKSIEPPQYCVELPGGAEQCYPHDENTIAEETTSDEDRQKWEVYLENLSEYNSELTERMLAAMLVDQPIEFTDGWEERLSWLGIEVPDNEFDKKYVYCTLFVLKTTDDIEGFMEAVIRESMGTAGEEAVAAARDIFRGTP